MFPKSIRWQIQAFHGCLLIVLVAGLTTGFYSYERRARYQELDAKLLEIITPLLPRLAPTRPGGRFDGPGRRPPPREFEEFDRSDRPPPRERREFPEDPGAGPRGDQVMAPFESGKFYFAAWTPEGDLQRQSTNAPAGLMFAKREDFPGNKPAAMRTRDGWRELIHFMPNGAAVLVGASTAAIQAQMWHLGLSLAGAGALVIGLGLAGGWWLAGRAIRPIAAISTTAETIAMGDLSQRIGASDTESELGQLASVLNRTFEKLEKSFEQQVRFTADASHELRTPIAVILTQIQLALFRDRTPQEYKQTLATCERAVERMRGLVNSLLELARVDSGEFELMKEPCDLSRVAREALEFIQPLAKQRGVVLNTKLEPVTANVDSMKLSQVLINLLTNAIQHNPDGTEIYLEVQPGPTHAVLRVLDNGTGISAEALPHLFERFYRADKSRARAKGTTGLGLAISKAIVEAHGGTIAAESQPGRGTEFTIELPLA